MDSTQLTHEEPGDALEPARQASLDSEIGALADLDPADAPEVADAIADRLGSMLDPSDVPALASVQRQEDTDALS